MNQPTVCALMLTADRPALAKRAVDAFRRQTYPAKRLLILDTASTMMAHTVQHGAMSRQMPGLVIYTNNERVVWRQLGQRSIGELRNCAIEYDRALYEQPVDIICHWDDDDWSHPNRIAEQVALMESTGADVCGYNQMLFWRENSAPHAIYEDCDTWTGDHAWTYTGSLLGTSLCYRRAVWERFPFPDTSYGEDTDWLKRVQHAKLRVAAETSLVVSDEFTGTADDGIAVPRMIARIHAANTSQAYAPQAMKEAPHHWSRAPEWDEFCRKVMEC